MVELPNVFEAAAERGEQGQARKANVALKAVGDVQEACLKEDSGCEISILSLHGDEADF
jgi:hypothetical protein